MFALQFCAHPMHQSRSDPPARTHLYAAAGRRTCGGERSCGKIGNRAFVARHTCTQGVCIVVPHLSNPLVMLRSLRNVRSPFSPPPPQISRHQTIHF
eukprot:5825523-Prymnesium_polylepis.1